MDNLPTDVVWYLARYLDIKSLVYFGCVNKFTNEVVSPMFTHTKYVLLHPKHSPGSKAVSTIFRYSQSLRSYEEMERWAKLASGSNDPTLYMRVRDEIVRKIQLQWTPVNRSEGLTIEQARVVRCPPSLNKTIMVQAFAGTGKTKTLFHYANAWRTDRVLYVAYNVALAAETSERFKKLTNVTVKTMHSYVLNEYGDTTLDIGACTISNVAHIFPGLDDMSVADILTDFGEYCSSDRLDDGGEHVKDIWYGMFTDKTIPVTHDAYLKAYQLQQNKTCRGFDIILVDEIQDFTDCMLNIICNYSNVTKLFVGDTHQQIYGFKHVHTPYSYIHDFPSHSNISMFGLTKTFRFGYDLMYFTNIFMNNRFGVRGFTNCATGNTTLHRMDHEDYHRIHPNSTFIARYNSTLYDLMFKLSQMSLPFHVYGKSIDFDLEMDAMTDLKHLCLPEYFVNHTNSNPLLDKFTSLEEFENHARTSQLVKWLLRINLWKKYETDTVRHLSRAKEWYSPTGFTLITAHQSKGLEFDHVVLCNDIRFDNPQASNLMYVALTRAKHSIHISIKLLNYLFSKRNNLGIQEAPAPKNKRCTRCKNRFTNQRQMVECDPDVLINHACELHIIEPVCSQCATRPVDELAPKTWS